MDKSAKIFVAGHRGMVGSAIVRELKNKGYTNIITKTRDELNLLDQKVVNDFFASEKPEYVVDSAAKVGGIKANMTYPAEFLYENLVIQNNLIWAAKEAGVKKFLFLGSSCIYPRQSPQPMKEEYFLDGKPEPTNEGYAIAKIAGMKLCEYIYTEFNQKFISCMPTNIYGENDNFDPETSHVVPSLLRRIHEAKVSNTPEVVIWGTGVSRREFLHVDDLAEACVWMLESYNDKQFLNVGTGEDISIKELAETIQKLVGYQGKLVFDATKPDGMPKKLLDVSKLKDAGWTYKIKFEDGLKRTYDWYLKNIA
ncbi:MAG TPA: GDP-L-fucose synthase [Candidatus Saccharimonadales bacterium]|nr:GDP-L-fucose synthase [Candidatus Saccharimonadales bacterium]